MTPPVRLTRRPLSVAAAVRALATPGLGGVALFAGRVRPDARPPGRVVAIDYEADLPLARRRLSEIERTARARYGAGRVVLWHRLGRVRIGEIAVVTGAACRHRANAFAAARFLIEELKRSVPIWKTERARPARPRRPRPGRRA